MTGPETLSYDDVADLASTATGRKILHHRLTEKQMADRFIAYGMSSSFAPGLAAMDTAIATGAEDRTTDHVFKVTGRAPGSFKDFVTGNAAGWAKNIA